jgi:hypothetical protein
MCISAAQAQQECVDTYVVLGSSDVDGDGTADGGCYTDGTGYYDISWSGGCLATNLNYSGGDIDITANGFTEGLIFFGFEAGIEETIIITFEDGGIGNYGPVTNDCVPAECGNGTCEAGETATTCPEDCEAGECPAGQVADCDGSGECWTEAWIGDTYCDGTAQQYGADLCCYENDGGDCTAEECVAQVCGDGVCGPGENPTTCPDDCSASDCVDSYVVEGSTDLDGDGAVDLCYTDGSGYYNIVWTGGCLATNLNYSGGDIDITANGFTAGFVFFGFDPGIEEDIIITFEDGGIGNFGPVANDCPNTAECGNGVCEAGESFETCPADCVDGCQAGEIEDCDGTGECHPDTWVGDGYCDGTDQQYGADLCCYDTDAGDCTAEECEGGGPFCGDGVCDADEDYLSCPADCEAPNECPEDLNGDGEIGGPDLTILLAAYGSSCTGCDTDLNGDGETGGPDLTILLAAYGSSCE